jgi:hypothetical protein
MVSRQCYKLQDFLSWDHPKGQPDAAGVYSGRFEGLVPTNQSATDAAYMLRPDGTDINNFIYEVGWEQQHKHKPQLSILNFN